MKPYAIIDAHTHIFPQKIADKAVGAIGEFYDIPMRHAGTSERLLASGSAIGVRRYLVCSTATRGDQVRNINDFIHAECAAHPEFYGFGTLHPDMESPSAELERVVSLGLHGIKLHPDFQRFDIDDSRMIDLYRRMAALHLPVLFHTGDDRYDYSNPARVARVCERVDGFVCIAAHFGGYSAWDLALDALRGVEGVYFDTSSSLFKLPIEQAREMIEQLGPERFFFGTDFPMWDHQEELARFEALALDEPVKRAILAENFQRVFPLSGREL